MNNELLRNYITGIDCSYLDAPSDRVSKQSEALLVAAFHPESHKLVRSRYSQ